MTPVDRPFRFGVRVSRFDPAVDLRDLGQRAEALGYSTVLVNDHLVDQPAPLLALLAIANALSHDIYYKMIDTKAPTTRRLLVSRILLVIVAVIAAYVASTRPAGLLSLIQT